jgi:hypothetical protein
MSKISEYWDKEVKVVAERCVVGSMLAEIKSEDDFGLMPEIIGLMIKSEDELTPEDGVRFEELSMGRVDAVSMFFIGRMVWAVEHDLADGRDVGGGMVRVSEVHATLSDPEYWAHVWRDRGKDMGIEEALNLKSLRERLGVLLEMALRVGVG